MMAPRRLEERLPRPPHRGFRLVVHLVGARAAQDEGLDAGTAVRVWWGGAVGGEGYEQGDEGFRGGVGGVLVGEEGYGFAGAAVEEVRGGI